MENIRKSIKRFRRHLGFQRQKFTAKGEFELRLLRHLVPQGAIVADVGANRGVYSFHLQGFASQVWAFEPNANYHERLRELGPKVRLEDVALSNTEGNATLSIPLKEGVGAHGWGTIEQYAGIIAETRKVKLRTLDSYSLDLGFIKIDVEGHELAVLGGAMQTLKKCRPNLLVESEEYHRSGSTSELFSLMNSLDYNGFFFKNKKCISVINFNPKLHQPDGLICPGDKIVRQELNYINNFVFLPKENQWLFPFRYT